MASLKPLNDFVLLDPEPPPPYHEYKQYTNIIVPDKFEHGPEDRPVWGTVLALGPNYRSGVVVGDRIVVGKWSGARIKHEEHQYLIVKPEDILAVDGRTADR